jgi:hypothetical protein
MIPNLSTSGGSADPAVQAENPTSPIVQVIDKTRIADVQYVINPGLTKREFFAAMSMVGQLAAGTTFDATAADAAVDNADFLLASLYP